MNRITNTLTLTVAALVAAIGTGAFVISYDALYNTGLTNGTPERWAWIWPLLIDLPLIVFTVAMLSAQLTRQSIKLWAGLVLLYTVGTIGFNLSHARPTPLGWLVAVVAPLGLLLTTEALRHLAKGTIERAAAVATLAELSTGVENARADLTELQSGIEQHTVRISELKTELARLRAERKAEQYQNISDDTRSQAAQILAERSDISGAELARLLGKSDTLARRLKKELLPVVNGHQNGNGHQVTL